MSDMVFKYGAPFDQPFDLTESPKVKVAKRKRKRKALTEKRVRELIVDELRRFRRTP
jgi:hypothetical protein